MPLDFPSIVPENNLRLPDALTIKYGPAPLLSRFVLEGDKAVRQIGMRLRVRHDFDELVHINRQLVAHGLWYPLISMFDPDYADLRRDDSFWLSGEDEHGEIVLTWAARVFNWQKTTLADNLGMLLCERMDRPRPCLVSDAACRALRQVRGVVFWGGSLWIHPRYRHRHLSPLVGRLGRAFAVARWPLDWVMCLVEEKTVKHGLAAGYGYRHMTRGIFFPGSQFEEEVFAVYLSADEAYADFSEFLASELADARSEGVSSSPTRLLETVISTSSDRVFHGSTSRS
jgi:hypothetical protein